MPEAYIVAAVRTASGRCNGRLAAWHPAHLGAAVLDELVLRAGVDPAAIDDVIMGTVSQAGEQAGDMARNAILASDSLPLSIPGVTIDRQCGSSQQAVQFAAQAVLSGTQGLVIASGVESMTRVPLGSPSRLFKDNGLGTGPLPADILARLSPDEISQYDGAERMVVKYGFTRDDLDRYALESHRRASLAARSGRFTSEILSLPVDPHDPLSERHSEDEGIRHDASLEAMASLRTLREGGAITAASASQIADGASAMLIASADAVKAHGLTPLARIHGFVVTAGDPVMMLDETVGATQRLLRKAGMTIGDIELYEINEAFAPVPLSWLRMIDADPARINVNGGAISLGHPLGASGTKLMTTLVYELRARGARFGLQAMC
ncbi:MAG: acetyl-CoA C-acyltransferase, partial [Sphingobium sp.]